MEVTHQTLGRMLDLAYKSEPPTPIFVWGPTGVGKSESVAKKADDWAAYEKRGLTMWNEMTKKEKLLAIKDPSELFIMADLRLSQYDPSDLRGIPKIVSKIDASEWHIPMLFKVMGHEEARGVVFFDELNLAPPSILASCYQLIHDRQVGEHPINPHILLLAAGNRAEDRANVFDMPAPLKNRFGHLTLDVPDHRSWIDWAMKEDVDSRILAFIMFKPDALHNFKKGQTSPAFATPRSWVTISRMIADVDDLNAVKGIVSMLVGDGTGSEFHQFTKLREQVDIEKVLEHPEQVSKVKDPTMKWAIVTSVADVYRKVKGEKRLKSVVKGVCGVADQLDNGDPEFGILLLRLVSRSRENWMREFLNEPLWKKIATRYQDLVVVGQD